jgi:hypothetical protein
MMNDREIAYHNVISDRTARIRTLEADSAEWKQLVDWYLKYARVQTTELTARIRTLEADNAALRKRLGEETAGDLTPFANKEA